MNENSNIPDYSINNLLQEKSIVLSRCRGNKIHTGFGTLDLVISCFEPQKLYVIGGRPSVGKTTFMLSVILNILRDRPGNHLMLFSPELSKKQVVNRLLCSLSGVTLNKINDEELTHREVMLIQRQGIAFLQNKFLSIDDTSGISIEELCGKLIGLQQSDPVNIVFIDYLQLIKYNHFEENVDKYAVIMSGLQNLASKLNIPVVVLSQLNSEYNKTGTPVINDLYGSENIGKIADTVLLLHRPEFSSIYGETYLDVVKNSIGPYCTIRLKALFHQQKFIEIPKANAFLGIQ